MTPDVYIIGFVAACTACGDQALLRIPVPGYRCPACDNLARNDDGDDYADDLGKVQG